jgi:hypothetical protein
MKDINANIEPPITIYTITPQDIAGILFKGT